MLADGRGSRKTYLGLPPHHSCHWHPWVIFGGGNCSCCCLQYWCTVHLQCLWWKLDTNQLAQWITSQTALLNNYNTNVVIKMWPWIHHLIQKNWRAFVVVKIMLLMSVQWLLWGRIYIGPQFHKSCNTLVSKCRFIHNLSDTAILPSQVQKESICWNPYLISSQTEMKNTGVS